MVFTRHFFYPGLEKFKSTVEGGFPGSNVVKPLPDPSTTGRQTRSRGNFTLTIPLCRKVADILDILSSFISLLQRQTHP